MKSTETPKLAEWEKALESEREQLTLRREQIDAELQRISRKIELLRQMRSLDESPITEDRPRNVSVAGAENRATPASVRETAKRILADAGTPLHISEIHKQFLNNGYLIPGSGTPFNILAHIVNDKSFARVARGTYALAEDVPADRVLAKAPRKRRASKKKKRSRSQRSGGSRDGI
jgi:hypothetical protein